MTRSGPTRERRNPHQRRPRRWLTATVAATAYALTGTFAAVPASAAPAAARPAAAGAASAGSFRLVDIPMKDGVVLKGDVLTPAPGTPGADARGRYPVVVEPASWGQNDLEFLLQSRKLAADGYVVVTYTVRGFWLSGGQVDVAGPKDVADISSVIDWTLAHTPADPHRVGMTGLSLGAGMSLMGAAFDPRVKAVAAMSAWGDLVNSLYSGQTRHVGAVGILTAVQIPTGRQSPETHQAVSDMFDNRDIPQLIKWARTRSPGSYVDRINAHHTAVFIANAWSDSIFNPSQVSEFYQRLTGPKRLELRPGDHATQEIGGMLGLRNPAWDDGRAWFDQHLKNLGGDAADHRVQLQVRENAGQESYPDWRSISTHSEQLRLGPANALGTGTLGGAADTGWRTSIMGGVDSGADSGITELSGGLDQFLGIPPTVEVPLLPRAVAAVWQSAPYSEVQHIRGTVGFHTTVTSSAPKGTVFAYLYDVNALGVGKLITHAPQSWSSAAGRSVPLDVSLFATAYDLPAGHRLALVLDTRDPMYGSDTPLGSRVSFGSPADAPSRLTVPLR